VIGVLMQPIDASLQPFCATCTQYTVASYVQWIQAAGARVALLQYNGTAATLAASFLQLSGLMVPGGHCGFHTTETPPRACSAWRRRSATSRCGARAWASSRSRSSAPGCPATG